MHILLQHLRVARLKSERCIAIIMCKSDYSIRQLVVLCFVVVLWVFFFVFCAVLNLHYVLHVNSRGLCVTYWVGFCLSNVV